MGAGRPSPDSVTHTCCSARSPHRRGLSGGAALLTVPDDAVPAGAKSPSGAVAFHSSLSFLPVWDPGTGPSHVCFPSVRTPAAGLASVQAHVASTTVGDTRRRRDPRVTDRALHGEESQSYTNETASRPQVKPRAPPWQRTPRLLLSLLGVLSPPFRGRCAWPRGQASRRPGGFLLPFPSVVTLQPLSKLQLLQPPWAVTRPPQPCPVPCAALSPQPLTVAVSSVTGHPSPGPGSAKVTE